MKLINKIKRKVTNLRHSIRAINDYHVNSEIYKTLIEEISEISEKHQLGNLPWEGNRREIRRAFLEDDISDFLNWEVVKKTMIYESGQFQYEVVKNDKNLLKAIKESRVGNPKPYWLDSSTSGNAINHAYSIKPQQFKTTN